MSSPSFFEKVRFFDQLESLDKTDTDDDEVRADEEKRRKFKATFESSGSASVRQAREAGPRQLDPRSEDNLITMPPHEIVKATPLAGESELREPRSSGRDRTASASLVEESAVPEQTKTAARATTGKRTANSAPPRRPSRGNTSPPPRKRKCKGSQAADKTVPEADQVLRGLALYYIPNNDVAPHRRVKMGKAQEYGARRVVSLDEATHAVVDKSLAYKDVDKILAPAAASLVVVNEDYPIDCIAFRSLLNADQHRYRVSGSPQKEKTREQSRGETDEQRGGKQSTGEQKTSEPAAGGEDRQSLPIKEPKGMPPGHTPGQSEESSIEPRERNNRGQETGNQAGGIADSQPDTGSAREPSSTDSPGNANADDDLGGYISLVRQYKDLPLDEEGDDDTGHSGLGSVSDSDGDGDSASSRGSPGPSKRVHGGKSAAVEENFACHRGGTRGSEEGGGNPNARTIEVLQAMCDYYERVDDHWRTTAYRRAMATLRRQTDRRIATAREAKQLPAIGGRLAQKIEEIAQTDGLRRLEYARDEPLDGVLATFLGVYDVGAARARRWVARGFRTLDDLLERAALTPNQRVGVERYTDLNTRIPRAEVAAMGEYVRAAAATLDPDVEMLVGGSFRRGAEASGDVDFIATKKGTTAATDLAPFLAALLDDLDRRGFVLAHLQRSDRDGGSQWHGCCALPAADGERLLGEGYRVVWRRVDFLLVPETEFGAALLYFTGNDIFNRSMRLLASRRGMRLNQRGLFRDVMRGPQRAKVTEGQLVESRDERRIFELLGVRWREPHERWC